jgi:hypothetical protein
MRTLSKLSILVLAAANVVVVACSSSGSDGGHSASGALSKPTSSSSSSSSSSASASPSGSPVASNGKVGDATTCGATPSTDACGACCTGGPDSPAYKVELDAFSKCQCDQVKASCSAECATTACAASSGQDGAQVVNPACDSCNPDLTPCDDVMKKACAADPTCAAAQKCYDDSHCDAKPAGPDEADNGIAPDGG